MSTSQILLGNTVIKESWVIEPASTREMTQKIPNLKDDLRFLVGYKPITATEISNAIIDTKSGVIFTKSFPPRPILESSYFTEDSVSNSLRPRVSETLKGTFLSLSSRSFAHWLIEDVPRFLIGLDLMTSLSRTFSILISNDAPKYVREFLEFSRFNSISIHESITPSVSSLLCVYSDYYSNIPRVQDLMRLNRFGQDVLSSHGVDGHSKRQEKRKLFISRQYSTRFSEFEKCLQNEAQKNGFTVVYPEMMPLVEQIKIFSSASVIMGCHGAGLYNMIWNNTSATIIDIYHEWHNSSLKEIAESIGIRYQAISTSNLSHLRNIIKSLR